MTYLRLITCSLYLILATSSQAQIFNPIKWNVKYEQVKDNIYDVIVTAKIDSTWKLYYKQESTDGPPNFYTKVEYKHNISIAEAMKNISVPSTTYDEMFRMVLSKFKNEAIFKQRITILDPKETATIKIYWTYMTCNAERCLVPSERCAKIDIKPQDPKIETIKVNKLYIVDCGIDD